MVNASFCMRAPRVPGSRLFEPELAGGALLDVGIYTVELAAAVFGAAPERISGLAHLGSTGVDEQSGTVLDYGGGWIRLHDPFWHPQRLTVAIEGCQREIELPYRGNGYAHEAEEVGRCLAAGRRESEIMPLDDSLAIADTLDRIRARWGLVYPMEA